MTLDQYFALPDTPMRGSPVGFAMQKIAARWERLDFDEVALQEIRVQAIEEVKRPRRKAKSVKN